MSTIGRTRVPLLLSDIIDMNQQQLKNVTDPIYYNNIRVVWPPEWNGMDELTFHLDNGESVDVFIYGDTHPIDDGNDEQFNNMEIAVPIGESYVESKTGTSFNELRGMGGRRSRRHKKTKKRKSHRKTRKHRRRRHKA
jgi:hypothetical protein